MFRRPNAFHRVGVCLFDRPDHPDMGTCSIEGAPPIRIKTPHDLASDVFWLTNIPYRAMSEGGWLTMPNLGYDQYLRTALPDLMEEMGWYRAMDAAPALSLFASNFFRQSLQHHAVGAGKNAGRYRFVQELSANLVPADEFALPPSPTSAIISEALRDASQENQGASGITGLRGLAKIIISFPRFGYARWLTSIRVPDGSPWTAIKIPAKGITLTPGDSPKAAENRAFVSELAKGHATIFRISIVSMAGDYAKFASFGISGMSSNKREWATGAEVLRLADYASLVVHEGYLSGYRQFPGIPLLDDANNGDYALSTGVLAENTWVSLIMPGPNGRSTPSRPYLRAADRYACGRIAEALHQSYTVGSYSTGRVVVFCAQEHVYQLCATVMALGLLPPLAIAGASEFHAYLQNHPLKVAQSPLPQPLVKSLVADRYGRAVRQLILTGKASPKRIMELEDALTMSAPDRDAFLSALLTPMGAAA